MTEQTPPQGGARKLPLEGFKVIELGHYIAGPFAARLLADMGAEVIKIEPPEGDPHRGWGSQVDGHAVWFSIHGRNKTCITLDLKSAEGREKVKALAARADALIENFRPGYLERIGLGPDVLQAINPKLTIARVSGYGQDGPYRDKPAFGSIGEAMGGIRHLTATPGVTDHPPPRCGVSIADDVAGIYAAMAVLGAAWATKADPAAKGRVIDVDLVGSIFSLMEGMLPEYGLFGWVRQPHGAALPAIAQVFGNEMVSDQAGLDRNRMRALAFGDPSARRRLEGILHPLIGETARAEATAATQAGAAAVVFDVPLLAESAHWRDRVDRVLVVDCEESTQISRVMARNGWAEETVLRVIAQQAPRPLRRSIADAVIFNDTLSQQALQDEVRSLWSHWLPR